MVGYEHWVSCRSEDVDLEKDFEQNELNSAVYLISMAMQISNFAVNYKVCKYKFSYDTGSCAVWCLYLHKSTENPLLSICSLQGHPFMASLTENRPLLYSLLISASVLFVLASGFFPDLSAMFEIEIFTEEVCLSMWLYMHLFIDSPPPSLPPSLPPPLVPLQAVDSLTG